MSSEPAHIINAHQNPEIDMENEQIMQRQNRMINPHANSCFCCRVHQGFINIAYIDIARIFWGISSSLIVYRRSSSIHIDYAATSVTLIAIILQAIVAISSVKRALFVNNFRIYGGYLYLKIFFLIAFAFENIIKDIIICKANLKQIFLEACGSLYLNSQSIFFIIWLLLEIYIATILFLFYKKSARGDYGPLGSLPNFGDQILALSGNKHLAEEAISVEIIGLSLKNPYDVEKKLFLSHSFPLRGDLQFHEKGITFCKQKAKYLTNEINFVDLTEVQHNNGEAVPTEINEDRALIPDTRFIQPKKM